MEILTVAWDGNDALAPFLPLLRGGKLVELCNAMELRDNLTLPFYLQRSPSQNLYGLILLDYGDRDNYVCEDADDEGPEPSFTTVAPPSPPDSRSP